MLVLAVYALAAAGLLVAPARTRAAMRRGRPPARDLDPREVAYLRGGESAAIAVALAALKLDKSIKVHADGRLSPGDKAPTGGAPLDAALRAAIAGASGTTLPELAVAPGVQEALGGIRGELAAQGMVVHQDMRRRLRRTLLPVRIWVLLGAAGCVAAGTRHGVPVLTAGVLLLVAVAIPAFALGSVYGRTAEGQRALDRAGKDRDDLVPPLHDSYGDLAAPEVLMAVALFGAPALTAWDPVYAKTVGMARHMDTGGGAGTGGSTYVSGDSSGGGHSHGGSGHGGGHGCGGAGCGGSGGCGGGGCGGGGCGGGG
ncbi:TIGR04222 domain-containing membrane protein [Actinomadura napierensis]|uniref:TIGR04222 domain-containing membrane protein n=1 Tax=Actinomadura napierensis TaxID=267854 RepID=UPI0031DB735E